MDDLEQIISSWKYFKYRRELEDPVSPTDYLAVTHEGEIISRDYTKSGAESKAIARGS